MGNHIAKLLIALTFAVSTHLASANPGQADGTQADGTQADGTQADGTQADGAQADGTQADGTQADGTQADGAQADGAQADGTQADGAQASMSLPELRQALKNGDYVLMAMSSKKCHSQASRSFNRITLKSKSSNNLPTNIDDVKNAYPNMSACVADNEEAAQSYDDAQLATASLIEQVKKDTKVEIANEEQKQKKEDAEAKLYGMNFGIGVGYIGYNSTLVNDVSIQSRSTTSDGNTTTTNYVSVDETRDSVAALLLESHFMFAASEKHNIGIGPFVAVQVTDQDGSNPLSGIGLGGMVSFGRNTDTPWNLGVGYFIENRARVLRDGISDGSVTEETDDDRVTMRKDVDALLIIFSRTF